MGILENCGELKTEEFQKNCRDTLKNNGGFQKNSGDLKEDFGEIVENCRRTLEK